MSKNNNVESITIDSTQVKDRETYSFTVSNKNNFDIAMQEFINAKIKTGTKMSSYIRFLIEKEMQAEGVEIDGYEYSISMVNKSCSNLDVLSKLSDIESLLNKDKAYSTQAVYDKIVGLEYSIRNISSAGANYPVSYIQQPQSVDSSLVINKLDTLISLMNSSSNNSGYDYSNEFRDFSRKISKLENELINGSSLNEDMMKIVNKINSLERLVTEQNSDKSNVEIKTLTTVITKLSEQIDNQTSLIDNLNDTISVQNKIIKSLTSGDISNVTSVKNTVVDEYYDKKREEAQERGKDMIETEI